jgi:hypothetical protein
MSFDHNRRKFLKDSAMWIMAVPAVSGSGSGHALLQAAAQVNAHPDVLRQAFLNPPEGAWPWVYWYGNNGNITREGITADLEAMHRVGIRGVLYMEVDQFIPKGPVRFLSPEWREMMQHVVKESTRLGITVNMNNDGGWCGSGGPWITPELSMQVVVWSEATIEGGRHFTGTLAQPKTVRGYYRDIAVLAFPTPAGERVRMADRSPKLTYGVDRKSFDYAELIDGNPGTVVVLPLPPAGQPQYLNIEFAEPFTAQALTVAVDTWSSGMSTFKAALEVSDDGQNFRTIRNMNLGWPVSSVNFPKVNVRYYRIVLKPDLEDEWFWKQFTKGIPLGEVELCADLRIEDIPGKAAYLRPGSYTEEQDALSGEPDLPPAMVVPREQVLDLSRKMDQEGHLDWYMPAGKWTVLRIGHTSTGKMNHPAPEESLGLECDKLSKKAIEVQFAGLVGKLLEDQAAIGGRSLTMTHIDSWETGSQNWTPGFQEVFQSKYGYDLLPYLPILTGRAVESREVSERFLWDLRRILADMLLENYAGHLREISHQHGLTLSIEAYGAGPLEEVAYGGRADVPMGEFWVGPEREILGRNVKEMASSAHVYGRPVVAAEAFTATPDNGKWQNHPFRLKPLGDFAFTRGINRFVMNMCTLQPWAERKPGMTTGPWGFHFDRTTTWWEQSRAWLSYLARCQALLQSGRFVADVAYLGSENAPNSFPARESIEPEIPRGYDFDDLPPEVLLSRATARDGRLALESGMIYEVLVVPPVGTITPRLLRKVKELVRAGVTVVGPRPLKSPSLEDYPRCDHEVQQLAEELWGECDGVSIRENRYGDGKVIWGKSLRQVLEERGTVPDFSCLEVTVGEEIRYIHRSLDGDDLYFVASGLPEARRFLCTFRTKGRQPELWWPDTGRTEVVSVFKEEQGRLSIPLSLDPYGSVFVVFRASTEPLPDHVVSIRRNGVEISGLAPKIVAESPLQHDFSTTYVNQRGGQGYTLEAVHAGTYVLTTSAGHVLKTRVPVLPDPMLVEGPWEVEFPKGWGAPERVTLMRLISWTEHPDTGVKYFSGTATYRRRLEVPARMLGKGRALYLDLGRVSVIAEAKLNDQDLGILWKAPFRVEVTDILRAGANDLEVQVVNLWPNRLIGDEFLPEDCEWVNLSVPSNPVPPDVGKVLARWPQWLLENKPRPTERVTFITWKHWTKEDPLLESGLLGPVRIITTARMPVE